MFRLFRRRKKDKKKEKAIEEKTGSQVHHLVDFSSSETPFEETFATIPKIITETFPEEPEIAEPIFDLLPFAETVVETEASINSFISPELLKPRFESTLHDSSEAGLATVELTPIALAERIEGALFSIGRPIHATELIESLQEESPLVKRTLRKLSRKRKRNSPIVIEEISRDRWVLQLNPIYHEFFNSQVPQKFLTPEERRIITEISYRQPISLAMLKKIVRKIGPVKITEICRSLEAKGYTISEKRARSIVYTSTPKFAHDFGFDNESRRLKLQMLWRLKRLMGDYEVEEEEEAKEEEEEEEAKEEEKEEEAKEVEEEEEPEKETELETKLEAEIEQNETEEITEDVEHEVDHEPSEENE
ncbi:MAG: SMC-Scp complex subunit ScpB [Candidatus Hodarchaeales archaeon]|jgi:chromosome segregation and condensation protein ScpB